VTKQVLSGTTNSNPLQFTGRENDATGLYFLRARYYNPEHGRFISEDPIGIASGSTNLYTYVLNSPANFTDPLGLHHDWWHTAYQDAFNAGRVLATVGRKLVIAGEGLFSAIGDFLSAGGCMVRSLYNPFDFGGVGAIFEGGLGVASAGGAAISYAGTRGIPLVLGLAGGLPLVLVGTGLAGYGAVQAYTECA
jgi:RHS repeat-associated protein